MSEASEDWAAYKKQQKLERQVRRMTAESQLQSRGISYTVHNDGAHIVITEGGATFDYWPGTTRWRVRPHKSQYGVQKLFAAVAQRRLANTGMHPPIDEVTPWPPYRGTGREHPVCGVFTERDEAFVERMERAYPHIKGEEA